MNTTYFLNCIAGNVFGTQTSPVIPTDYYIGLSTTAPSIDGSGVTEPPIEAHYSRIKLFSLSEPDGGIITNQHPIKLPMSTDAWGTITHYVIFDSEDVGSGNLLIFGAFEEEHIVDIATIPIIKPGYLKLSVQNPV